MSSSSHTTPVDQSKNADFYDIPSKGNAVTSIETRTDLSTLYRVLRLCIRPLRPRLVALKPLNITGSPQIVKRPTSHYGVTISERIVQIPATQTTQLTQADAATNTQKLWLYDFNPQSISEDDKSPKSDPWWTHTIYYFAGGGFQAPASAEHWKLTARLAKDLSPRGVRVVMVSYPLAPNSPAKDSLPLLRAWLAQTLYQTAQTSQTMSLMGDSAGGNVVLSLAHWWATHLVELSTMAETDPSQIQAWKHLIQVMALSPPCDFRDTNPRIEEADTQDPVLAQSVTSGAGDLWCEGWEKSPLYNEYAHFPPKWDPQLSMALHGEESWKAVRESGLVIDGVVGTADRLAPDAMVYMKRCLEHGVRGSWLVWEGQMHCFPLTVCYGLQEGRDGFEWMKKRVEGVLDKRGDT